jgi:acyl-CoA hydrolase
VLTVSGAPATGGPFTITVRATDNCNAVTDATLTYVAIDRDGRKRAVEPVATT